jgi:ParB/RepB/Spo0J family partition protein
MAGTADQTVLLIPVDELHAAAGNRVVGNVDDLAASIADLGVLQPLLVEPDPSGGYEVVCGARRLAAAKQAGCEGVPATVRTFADEKDKLVARACENLNREDLTPLQEAAAYQQLLALGLSQHAVGKRVSRSQSHISKRLRLLELPEEAKAAVDAGRISVGDAVELVKLAEQPKRVAEVLKAAKQGRDVGHTVEWQLRESEREQKRAAAIAEQKAAGVAVLNVDHHSYYGRKERPLGKGYDHLDVDVAAHAGQSCHAAAVDNSGRVQLVCRRPDRHPEARKGRTLTDVEKEERARKRQENKDRRAAQEARDEALRALVRKRLPKAAVFEHVLTQWVLQRSANHVPARIACELLGLVVPARKNSWDYVDYATPLRQHAAKGPDQLARVGLALAFGGGEEPLRGDWPNWSGEGVHEHFGFLQAQGYELAPIEQTKLHSSKPGDDGDEPEVQADLDDSDDLDDGDVAGGAP